MAFVGLPPIIDVHYDREGTPGHACNGCNSAWPVAEGDDEPGHHDIVCPWYAELTARDRVRAARELDARDCRNINAYDGGGFNYGRGR